MCRTPLQIPRIMKSNDKQPETLPLRIKVRRLLTSGGLYTDEGCLVKPIVMLIDKEQSEHEMTVSLWHETVHLLLAAAGKKAPHDEQAVEAMAKKLSSACPEILSLCGLKSEQCQSNVNKNISPPSPAGK